MGQVSTTNCFYDSFCNMVSEKKSRKPAKARTMSVSVPGEDGARISRVVPHRRPIKLLYYDATTVVEALERGRKISGDGNCVGWRSSDSEYSWLKYSEFSVKAQNFGSGLMHIGANLGQHSIVGIYGKNSVEWTVSMYGCAYYSSPIIPLYDTLGPDACTFMINHAKIRFIICDDEKKARSLLEKKEETPSLEAIICIEDLNDDVKALGQEKSVRIYSFESVLNVGRKNPYPVKRPRPEDVMEICYTSGTTGDPKGAILTHENWIAAISGLLLELEHSPAAITKSDVVISYLPLAHVMEQAIELCLFMVGGSVGYYSGDTNLLLSDMKVLKPTFWPSVPRMLNKLYDMMQAKLNKEIMNMNGMSNGYGGKKPKDIEAYWKPELCKDFAENLGGNIKLILSAAAPISDSVLRFYRQVLGVYVLEVYGQTETTAPVTLNVVTENSFGHVGCPTPCNMVKLVDVPELGYFKKDGTGEMCIKGFNIMKGYYKDTELTEKTIDANGWMHTGDIAVWTPNGALKIIDRIKHILKLSQGEYVSPGKLENIYLTSLYISQIFVHGDSFQNYLVAIVIPDQSVVIPWCERNLGIHSWEEACNDPAVKHLILEDMNRLGTAAGLMSFEQVKKIHLHPHLLTLQEDHLTPTLKTRRSVCTKYFEKQLEMLYSEDSPWLA